MSDVSQERSAGGKRQGLNPEDSTPDSATARLLLDLFLHQVDVERPLLFLEFLGEEDLGVGFLAVGKLLDDLAAIVVEYPYGAGANFFAARERLVGAFFTAGFLGAFLAFFRFGLASSSPSSPSGSRSGSTSSSTSASASTSTSTSASASPSSSSSSSSSLSSTSSSSCRFSKASASRRLSSRLGPPFAPWPCLMPPNVIVLHRLH